jgi:DNA polymerase III alpha subunit/intein/homing endonuclease
MYSLLDSATKYDDYTYRAKESGMTSLGISCHGNVFNWTKKKQKCDELGIKYIHGQEFYITKTLEEKVRDNWHCILIAKNWNGVKELNRLSSIGYTRDGHYYYDPRISLDELINTSDNIIVTSACLGGILNKADEESQEKFLNFIIENKNRCFLEIQHHNNKDQSDYNKKLYDLSNHHNLRLIAGTDTHSIDKNAEKIRSILQKSKNINFPDEDSWDLVWKSYDELVECYDVQNSLPKSIYMDAIENTNVMANMIENFELDFSYKYPKVYNDSKKVFFEKVYDGLKKKGLENNQEYVNRIQYESEAIEKNGAFDYLLLQEKITDWCRENDILPGYSRGSVSGCLCAYLLGITDIDSIKFGMNFERFMNLERVSLSDIDIDYPPDKREMVKDYIFNDLGLNSCDIVAFNTVATKGAIKDVGRALEIPLTEIAEINKTVESLNDNAFGKEYDKLFELSRLLEGTITSVGAHASGMITSTLNIDEELGTFTVSTNPRKISQVDMKGVDSLNFVKLDILGLDNIQIINETCKLANIERLTPNNVDFEDDKVWNDILNSNLGIFQWESDFAHQIYKKLFSKETLNKIQNVTGKVDKLALLSIGNGTIRPAGESYRDAICNGEFKNNGHKALDKLLSNTMGYLVFQEDILKFLNEFCGYSMGEADIIRRCLDEDTEIMMENGAYKKIKNISVGDAVQSFNKYNISEPNIVKNVFNNGKKECIKIGTNHGYVITATKDHKVLTQNGWRELGSLCKDDFIMTPKRINTLGDGLKPSSRLDMTDMFLMGILIGDGSLGNINDIHFTNHETILLDKFKECVEKRLKHNGEQCQYNISSQNGKNVDKIYSISVRTKRYKDSLKNFIIKYGLNCVSGDKKIPNEVMRYPVGEKLSNLIAGLFNTDGGYNTNRGSLEYCSNSIILIKQLRAILLKYGIYSYISKHWVGNSYNYYSYRVNIISPEDLEKFKHYILPYIVGEKSIEFKKIITSSLSGEKYNYMLPSECKKEILDMSKNMKKSIRSVGLDYDDNYDLCVHKQEFGISDIKAKKIVQNLYCPKTYEIIMSDFIPMRITSIEYAGLKNVYDIEIENTHNYIANGLVVHNCFSKKTGDMEQYIPEIKSGFIKTMKEQYNTSEKESETIAESFLRVIEDASSYLFSLNHSYPYSMIGYICAYLRYYYKLEFVTTMLNVNKNDIEKSANIIDYAKDNKILIKPPKFRFSRSSYFFDRETNSIYKDISSIKFLNEECGEQLYEIGKLKFDNFVDFLIYVEDNLKINSRQMSTLIKIKFFDEFGNNKKLLNIYEEFSKGKNKYSNKLKEKTKLERIEYLRKLEEKSPNECLDILDQIYFEQESLGYIQATYEKLSKKLVFVNSLDLRFAPRVEVYCLANGKTASLKVYKKTYENNPFNGGELLFCNDFEKKKPVKFMDGKYVETDGEAQWWLTRYSVVTPEEFNKILAENYNN